MDTETNFLIQMLLAAALFASIFLLSRSNSRAESELDPKEKE